MPSAAAESDGTVADAAIPAENRAAESLADPVHPSAAKVRSVTEVGAEPDDADSPVWAYATAPQDGGVAPVPGPAQRVPGAAPDLQRSLASLNASVVGFFDVMSRLLSNLPAGPFSEFLSGALLLVRRGLFDQAPTVAPEILVEGVSRPLAPVDGSTFSVTANGELVGSLGAVDPEGSELSYTLSRAPESGTVQIAADGTWTYTPGGGDERSDTFAVTIDDGGWNVLDPFAHPAEVTIRVESGVTNPTSSKNGLIASDWLTVVQETGELDGDEPVMLTVVMTTTLGRESSTSTWLVDYTPNEIAGGVDKGDRVGIPNEAGDAWIEYGDNFRPLNRGDLETAIFAGDPVPIPLVLTVTVMLEGDATAAWIIGGFGNTIAAKAREIGEVLEDTKIVVDIGKLNEITTAISQAQTKIVDVVDDVWTKDLFDLVATRFWQLVLSAGDADDPVGLGVSALIPVEPSFSTDLIDPRGYCFRADCTVHRIDFVSRGSGYDRAAPPTVTFEGGLSSGGTPAKGIVELSGDAVGYIRITDPGSGYVTPPKLVFTSSSGSGAEATVALKGTFLDDQYMSTLTYRLRNTHFDSDIPVRYGFLMPPSALPGGKAQKWTTTYAGDFWDNEWAEWKVETEAWPRISW